ncbi:MAG TPA: tripartite tricarboxylate transporter substrate binding protein [Xanthobacteraceae bacterium]|jgi:tripartite-type tricarboxylate transporter receptor subunit TctC|nr:tripartite tricarboxylate transporter substrate binding protein [Xanthobacteraceae bacterium]
MENTTFLKAILGVLVAATLTANAFADSYPTRPIRLILPYNPGGIVDFVGRELAQHLGAAIGQTIVPENRPGAGAVVGTDIVIRSPPDGYTLLLVDPALVINQTLLDPPPYDVFKDLDAISVVSSAPNVVVVSQALNITTLPQLVAYGKANPGKLNYASPGVGTTGHLGAEMFKLRTGIDATHVPYKGSGGAFPDIIDNKVQFTFASIASALPFTSDNRVVPVAVAGDKRSPVYPNVPTLEEQGFPDFAVDTWLTLFAPAGLPLEIKNKLDTTVNAALAKPELKAALATIGVEPRGTSPAEASAFVRAEYDKWRKIIIEAKIKYN